MVKIDVSKCIGCGICQNICPEGFEVIRRKAHVRNEKADCIEEAAKACPEHAIILSNQDNQTDVSNNQNFSRGRGFGRGMGRGRGRGKGRGFGRGMGRRL